MRGGEMNCPYCNKQNFIPNVCFINTENYGSSFHNFPCMHCGKIVKAYFQRKSVVYKPIKTDQESDF